MCVQLLNNILGGTIIYFIRGRSPPRHNEIKAEQVGFGNLVHTSEEKICIFLLFAFGILEQFLQIPAAPSKKKLIGPFIIRMNLEQFLSFEIFKHFLQMLVWKDYISAIRMMNIEL